MNDPNCRLDLVLVPSNYRPEFLALCLEHLAKSDGGAEKEVWVSQDRHFAEEYKQNLLSEVREVVDKSAYSFHRIRLIVRHPHNFIGNVYNFMELYKEAYAQPDIRYVYLVEDDVMVGKDFFRWHEAVQQRDSSYFCSVGWHCIRNNKVKASTNPHAIVESAKDFSSIGVCWRREKLHRIVVHAKAEYYLNHTEYLKKAFPTSLIPWSKWTEQAGLVMRVLLETKTEFVVWSALRRCAHVGFNGYHRRNGYYFGGRLDQKIAELKSVIGSTEAMLGLSPEKYDDIQALAHVGSWKPENLEVVQRFPFDGTYE
jgi:hypothetical protein